MMRQELMRAVKGFIKYNDIVVMRFCVSDDL